MSSHPFVDWREDCASRWRRVAKLTTTVGVDVDGKSISVIRSSRDCSKVSSIAALAEVAVVKVLLSANCSEPTGNQDVDSIT